MIAVVIPAHNEEDLLPACLRSVQRTTIHAELRGEPVTIYVVLDACTDGTGRVAAEFGVRAITSDARNVGNARAIGAAAALADNARWLAFTDADSTVPADWLSRQLAHESDVVCGIIAVGDWSEHPAETRALLAAQYVSRDDHRHIHGANLGMRADVYRAAGGFRALAVHEDVTLVTALADTGARIAWVAQPCVTTSARRANRAPGGFANHLNLLAAAAPST